MTLNSTNLLSYNSGTLTQVSQVAIRMLAGLHAFLQDYPFLCVFQLLKTIHGWWFIAHFLHLSNHSSFQFSPQPERLLKGLRLLGWTHLDNPVVPISRSLRLTVSSKQLYPCKITQIVTGSRNLTRNIFGWPSFCLQQLACRYRSVILLILCLCIYKFPLILKRYIEKFF